MMLGREVSMRVHAVQTGTVRVKSVQRAWRGPEGLRRAALILDPTYTEPLPVYAWLIEHPEGLLLVDTGASAQAPRRNGLVRRQVTPEQELGPQVRALGLSPTEVRWAVLTHLHPDHAGGLAHVPQAEVLVSRREVAELRHSLPFTPRLIDYPHAAPWPFPGVYTLTQAGDVHIVPTPGHSPGHQSVIVQAGDTVLFFGGDLSFSEVGVLEGRPPGLVHDPRQARQTLQHVHDYVELTPTVYLPSHDPDAPRRLAERRLIVDCGC